MELVLGTLYLLGMLVPGGLGYDTSLALHRKQVIDKTVGLGEHLETYSCSKYHSMAEVLQNYKDDSRISVFLKNLDFYVLPALNIDGYIYPWTTIRVGQKAANALKAKHGTNYRVGSNPTSEFSRDWDQDIRIPFSYTFKLRDNGTHWFILPEDQIQLTCEEAMEAVLSILEHVHAKYWLSSNARKVTFTSVVPSLL